MSLVGTEDAPSPAIVSIAQGQLAIEILGREIGKWPLADLSPSRSDDSFFIFAEGEILLIEVKEPEALAQSLGLSAGAVASGTLGGSDPVKNDDSADAIAEPSTRARHVAEPAPSVAVPWWKFWSGTAWRAWMARRGPWREYRKEAGPIESELKAVRKRRDANESELETARRDLRWAKELTPRELPIKTRRNETGLGTVAGVSLKEIRKKDGKETWTLVDTGSVHVTDRRLVFSGRKDVEFRYDKLNKKGRTRTGLLLGVSSRKRDHTLDGPVEQLLVVLEAGEAAGEGLDPTVPFSSKVVDLEAAIATDEQLIDDLTADKELIPVPARPISPAWIPAGILLLLIGIGAGSQSEDSDPVVVAADSNISSTTTTEPALPQSSVVTTTSRAQTTTTSTQAPAAEEEIGLRAALIAAPLAGLSGDPDASPPSDSVSLEVVSITDGDTFDIRLADGSTDTIRLIGINSPERDECFADVATLALTALAPPGSMINVTSDVSDRDQFDRLLRYAWVGGMSINEELVRRGVAIARRYPPDTALADRLEAAQDDAEASDIGLWAPDACGPPVDAALRINFINYDAPGNDNDNLNEEWIRIKNIGIVVGDLTDWTIRDESASNRYSFPRGFTLAPDEAVTIHTGCGTDFGTTLFWCSVGSAVWNNDGDTAFLVDPSGNIHHTWSYTPETTTTTTRATTTTTRATTTTTDDRAGCHPSYPTVCIPPPPPDLNCGDIPYRRFQVTGSDPHGFDRDGDGVGCESG